MAEWITPVSQRGVFFAGHFVRQLKEQAVAHRDLRHDHLLGLRSVQKLLIDQQGGIEGFGLGEGHAVAFRQFLGRVALALLDEIVEGRRVDHRQLARFKGRAGFAGGESASPPTATNESIPPNGTTLSSVERALRDVLPKEAGRPPRRFLAGGEHFLEADRPEPQALRGVDLAVLEHGQQRAPAAHVGDEGRGAR